jgi:hypothetical protein
MKSKFILSGITALAFASSAMAATEVINVTGATAFRSAAIDTIIAAYGAGLTDVAHNGTAGTLAALRGAGKAIFKGTGIGADETIIRCTWTGSVAGTRDLAVPQQTSFLTTATFTTGGTGYTGPNGVPASFGVSASENAFAKFSFSDSYPATSPYDVSGLTDALVGTIVFIPVANKSATTTTLSNVTSQNLRALYTSGFQPLQLFTGVTTDTINVYNVSRNDASGTRTTYLSETGYGASKKVLNWKSTVTGSPAPTASVVTVLRLWPTGDGVNASTVWNTDTAGNGGFDSGGNVTSTMGGTSSSVQLQGATGNVIPGGNQSVLIISVLGSSDANTSVNTNGGKALAYNGVSITPGSSFSDTDKKKIRTGAYTMWSYQHFMYNGDLSAGDDQAFYDAIIGNIDANIGTAGLTLAEMDLASRGDDGGIVGY